MDLLDGLFDLGDRKRRGVGGFFHDDDHDDDHHDRHDDHNSHPYPPNPASQFSTNPTNFQAGVVCRSCSTQSVLGAKFCHNCGVAIEWVQNCASCGSKLPAGALFCPQCGYKSG
jgi:ribosomal protein L40E